MGEGSVPFPLPLLFRFRRCSSPGSSGCSDRACGSDGSGPGWLVVAGCATGRCRPSVPPCAPAGGGPPPRWSRAWSAPDRDLVGGGALVVGDSEAAAGPGVVGADLMARSIDARLMANRMKPMLSVRDSHRATLRPRARTGAFREDSRDLTRLCGRGQRGAPAASVLLRSSSGAASSSIGTPSRSGLLAWTALMMMMKSVFFGPSGCSCRWAR